MRIVIVGEDAPALYAAILLRRAQPAWQVILSGDHRRGPSYAQILANPVRPEFIPRDSAVATAIGAIKRNIPGVKITRASADVYEENVVHNLAYCTVSETALHKLLLDGARSAGCIGTSGTIAQNVGDADLVLVSNPEALNEIGGDAATLFSPVQESGRLHVHLRLGAPKNELALAFAQTPGGFVHAMAIPSTALSCSLIVEADSACLSAAGQLDVGEDAVIAWCQGLFPQLIGTAPMLMRSPGWSPVPVRAARHWHKGNIALIGAAASQSHYSIGLGVRSGFEDAEALADALVQSASVQDALATWQAKRVPLTASLHRAANVSATWLAQAGHLFTMPMPRFALACVTRSLRLTYTHVKKADPVFVSQVDGIIAGPAAGSANAPPPPMFTPFSLRGLTIPNRMAFSPMCMYSAHEGAVSDFQLVHLGARAVGGFGLVFAEMTNVTAQGRMTHHCAGMYAPGHVPAFKRITDYVHEHTESKIAIQLAHAGRKGSISRSWEKGIPLKPEEEWETLAPSAIPYTADRPLPREMTRRDIQDVTDAFAKAARMSQEAGFDMIEIHAAHGYLLSSFISPLSNRRTDTYGGTLQKRMRFPLEVFEAIRANFPQDKPVSVRISASDWRPDGVTPRDAIEISKMFHARGADIIAVSSSGVTAERRPAVVERLYQLAFSDAIRNQGKVPTMTVGGVLSHGDCNTIIASGRADICLMARGALNDPYFPQHAAREQGYRIPWTFPYARAAETPVRTG